ncbi:MAG: PadR family transcriptional regulator [Oscillospiraceae bacterium]|nr:PadR family transcriptional regulator [Oscillospiraceae bacterium]
MAFAMSPQLLDGCVLAVLSRGDAYGYILTQQMKARLDISESALYPVLRRLQRDGLLSVYDRPYQGRNRRYYAITPVGRTQLDNRRRDWAAFRDGVEELMKEETQDG